MAAGKTAGKDPRVIKAALQDAWAISDTGAAFARALEDRGYKLARGDSRAFVVVDAHGETYSLSRWLGVKARDLRQRLGDETKHQPVADVQRQVAADMVPMVRRLRRELLTDLRSENHRLHEQAAVTLQRHRAIRQEMIERHEDRRWAEARRRQARFRSGLKGIWDLVRGENKRIRQINDDEAREAALRDRQELDALIFAQLEERRRISDLRSEIAEQFALRGRDIRNDLHAYEDFGDAAKPKRSKRRPMDL